MTDHPTSLLVLRRCARLFVIVAIVGGSLLAVRLMAITAPTGGLDLGVWARETDPVIAVVPVLIAVAAGLCVFLLLATGAYVALRALGFVRVASACGWVLIPRLRRSIDRIVAIGVMSSVIAMGAGSARAYGDSGGESLVREPAASVIDAQSTTVSGSPASEVVREPDATNLSGSMPELPDPQSVSDPAVGVAAPVEGVVREPESSQIDSPPTSAPSQPDVAPIRTGRTDETTGRNDNAPQSGTRSRTDTADNQGGAVRSGDGSEVGPGGLAVTPPAQPTRYTVRAGDNLWAIAAHQIAAARNVDVASLASADIAPYWAQVVETNRSIIRSGNPSLIYPGEVFTLPAVA